MEMRPAAKRKQISNGGKLRSLGVKTMAAAIKSTAAMQPLAHQAKITQLNPRTCLKWQRITVVVVVNDDIIFCNCCNCGSKNNSAHEINKMNSYVRT